MTKVKLLRDGESLGFVFPPELVERLALHDGDELSVTESGGHVELRKCSSLLAREQDAIEHVLTTHARTFELLAKR